MTITILPYLIFMALNLAMLGTDILGFFLITESLSYRWNNRWLRAFRKAGSDLVGCCLSAIEATAGKLFKKTLTRSYLILTALIAIAVIKVLIAVVAGLITN